MNEAHVHTTVSGFEGLSRFRQRRDRLAELLREANSLDPYSAEYVLWCRGSLRELLNLVAEDIGWGPHGIEDGS